MVKVRHVLLAIACLTICTPWVLGSGGDGGDDPVMLKVFMPAKWEYVLPNETPLPFGSGDNGEKLIPIPHQGGKGFLIESDGPGLAVDTNGDGKVDEKVRGLAASIVLRSKSATGQPFSYGVRLVNQAGTWRYLAGCAMSGKLFGEDVKIVDLNGNGRYDDWGADAIIVGDGQAASFLSKIVSISGKLYEMTVNESGDKVGATPYAGETGTLNVAEGFKSDGAQITSAVVANAKGDVSFELSALKRGLAVPVGEYRLVSGSARKGSETVKVRGTNTKSIAVEAGKSTVIPWGGPIDIDFQFSVDKNKITVPTTIKFFGRGGEEYYEFKPDATSPKILVVDAGTKKKITEGRFGGC